MYWWILCPATDWFINVTRADTISSPLNDRNGTEKCELTSRKCLLSEFKYGIKTIRRLVMKILKTCLFGISMPIVRIKKEEKAQINEPERPTIENGLVFFKKF